MTLPIPTSLPPMEATSVEEIPAGGGWQYEPKWDGFRCLAFRDGDDVQLQSKSGQPLARYFPELAAAFLLVPARRFVLDGEIVIPVGERISFDELLMRIHPAASRVQKLAAEHPALFLAFDLLVDARGRSLLKLPLEQRRPRLEAFFEGMLRRKDGKNLAKRVQLSPATQDIRTARRWFRSAGKDLDGVIAKRLAAGYDAGSRESMVKVKPMLTADCVVGGFRYASKGGVVGSLLLGLYDDEGLLHHVGYTSSLRDAERKALTPRLKALIAAPGFTGRAPGGPSRWSTARSSQWQPLSPELVVEVEYDHITGRRFRHGTKLVRFRPDKAPQQCQMGQIEPQGRPLKLLTT